MRSFVMVVAMVLGACQMDEGAVDNGHLPGDCNNPVICRGPLPGEGDPQGGGTPVQMCVGCDCTSAPAVCHSCENNCGHAKFLCQVNQDNGCDVAYQQCREGCGVTQGATCVCPSH